MPVSPGTPSKKLLNASSPPAEAPMPTTSEGGRLLSQSRRIDPGLVVCPWLFLRADLASPTAPVCRTDFLLRPYTSRLRGTHKIRSVSGCKLPKAPRFRSDFAYFLPDLASIAERCPQPNICYWLFSQSSITIDNSSQYHLGQAL